MKNIIIGMWLLACCIACSDKVVEKPERFLSEDEMVDIIYDLSLLEGIRSSSPESIRARGINGNTYIYKKYKIDSLQLAQNERYYASDVDAYAKVYERVGKRIENNKIKADSLTKITPARTAVPQQLKVDSTVVNKRLRPSKRLIVTPGK